MEPLTWQELAPLEAKVAARDKYRVYDSKFDRTLEPGFAKMKDAVNATEKYEAEKGDPEKDRFFISEIRPGIGQCSSIMWDRHGKIVDLRKDLNDDSALRGKGAKQANGGCEHCNFPERFARQ